MLTRSDLYQDLFKLKRAGEDISEPMRVMGTSPGVPIEVIKYLKLHSPQFRFYDDLRKNQRVLLKNILRFDELSRLAKIKVCSSIITRAIISVEYKNLPESLLDELRISKVAKALDLSLSDQDDSLLDEVLSEYRNAARTYSNSVNIDIDIDDTTLGETTNED